MELILVVVLLIMNIPIYKFIFNLIFVSTEDFQESLRYVFTPDLISLFRGEYAKDWYGEMKVQFFVLVKQNCNTL